MEKTAYEIQKERIAEIEAKAAKLLDSVSVAALTSINENGYPRTCLLTKHEETLSRERSIWDNGCRSRPESGWARF